MKRSELKPFLRDRIWLARLIATFGLLISPIIIILILIVTFILIIFQTIKYFFSEIYVNFNYNLVKFHISKFYKAIFAGFGPFEDEKPKK